MFRLEDGLGPVAEWLARTADAPLAEDRLPHAIATGGGGCAGPAEAARIALAHAADYARFGYAPSREPVAADRLDRLAGWLAPAVAALDRRGRL